MKSKRFILFLLFISLITIGLIAFKTGQNSDDEKYLNYIVDTKSQDIQFYWKNDSGQILKSIQNLKSYVEGKQWILQFAMNAGMYNRDHSPKGLFIQYGRKLSPIDTSQGEGNFYLQPNGVFYITNSSSPFINKTSEFIDNGNIKFATQSGPMLVINGEINVAFTKGSSNLNIRNGVGILPDKRIVFAMSKQEINFYDFASYFKSLGCKNALYLDGLVSRAYLPEKNWLQTDGNFGVIIGVIKHTKK